MIGPDDLTSADLAALAARGTKEPPKFRGEPDEWIPCVDRCMTIGRDSACDVVLADPAVSPRHAAIENCYDDVFLVDTDSEQGSFVNGRRVGRRTRLCEWDLLQIGPYLLRFRERQLQWVRPAAPLSLNAVHLRQAVGSVVLLDHISLVCRPGEFVGLLGPSGAGKSTLLNALCGLRPAASGHVFLNGEPLYENFDVYRHQIGYVPQDDIVHAELTCGQALWYAGRLRMPNATDEEIAQRVQETLDVLELAPRASLQVSQLSGGQRKRINLGVELLSRPGILFLDEPTAGLDPATESRLMRTFQQLARQGRVVVCATHIMESVHLLDKIAVLVGGGRLAYFGPPDEARAYFNLDRFSDLYERLEEQPAAEWQRQFQQSSQHDELRAALADDRTSRPFLCQARPAAPAPSTLFGQAAVLAGRFTRTLAADPQILRVLLLQPVMIAALICLVFRGLPSVGFLLSLSAMWFGAGLSAQQIVKERAIYRRERLVNLRRDSYLLSKFLPLALVGVVQSAAMLLVAWLWKAPPWNWPAAAATVVLSSWNGVAVGLLVSSVSSNRDRASAAVPTALLPQIILAGVLVCLPDMPPAVRAAADLVAARWANQGMEIALLEDKPIDEDLLEEEGQVWPLWNLYPDYDLRKPDEQQRFLKDHEGKVVDRQAWLTTDLSALAGLVIVQLVIVGVVLRRQDTL